MFSLNASPAGQPAASGGLTLAQAVQEALAHNPALAASWRSWQAMRLRVPQEKAWDDPTLRYEATAARFVNLPSNSMADQTVTLEQTIPLTGKNLSRRRVAEAEAVGAYEDFRRQQLEVVAKVRTSYFQPQGPLPAVAERSRCRHAPANGGRAAGQAGGRPGNGPGRLAGGNRAGKD
ncbi:MAG: TolC family protein [Chthoniobacteraceae bacterium]